MHIEIDKELSSKLKFIKLGVIVAEVAYAEEVVSLSEEIGKIEKQISEGIEIEGIAKLDNIFHTREAYKSLGKKPSRYRPSAEALHRRIVRGLGVYHLNNIVDATNLISLKTRFSIGTYDCNKIGENIIATVGKEGETYEGIRKEDINIHNLPVLADDMGRFGNPCSDSKRAMIDEKTKTILMVLWSFSENDNLTDSLEYASSVLKDYCKAENMSIQIVS